MQIGFVALRNDSILELYDEMSSGNSMRPKIERFANV